MNKVEIFNKVREAIQSLPISKTEQYEARKIVSLDSKFGEVAGGLLFDSLDRIELILKLEEVFGKEIPDSERLEQIRVVGDIVEYIDEVANA